MQAKTPGQRIYKLRMQQGMSQAELAEKVGTTEQNIQKLEIGMIPDAPFPDIYDIATALNTNKGYILCWEPDKIDQPHLVGTMPQFSYAKFDDPEDDDELPFEEYPLNHVTSDIYEDLFSTTDPMIEEIFSMPDTADEESFSMSDTPDEEILTSLEYDEQTFIPDWERDPFWVMQERTDEECDQFIDTGKFNDHIEGYLTIVMRLMGYPEAEINSMRIMLFNKVFGKIFAAEARKTGECMGVTIKHHEPKEPDQPAIIYQFPTKHDKNKEPQ